MDPKRAKQIIDADELIHVMHDGHQIFIQHVDTASNTARIYLLDDPSVEFDVNIDQLTEQ